MVGVLKLGILKFFRVKPIQTENVTLQRCISSIKKWGRNEDTVFFTASQCCSVCCIYDRRVFSIYGNDNRFPNLGDMPDFLLEQKCPKCGYHFGYTIYFSSIQDKRKLNRDIIFSNRPFIDDSDEETLRFRKEAEKQRIKLDLEEQEYDWLSKNLSEIAPKSLSGYRRMKHSNSKNYQKLVEKAKEQGYKIKT